MARDLMLTLEVIDPETHTIAAEELYSSMAKRVVGDKISGFLSDNEPGHPPSFLPVWRGEADADAVLRLLKKQRPDLGMSVRPLWRGPDEQEYVVELEYYLGY
mgnify:CR=1 FL=1